MLRRLQRIRRNEIIRLNEVAADFGDEKDNDGEYRQKKHDADEVLDRVVGMERDAVERQTVGILLVLDLDAIRIVRSDLVQRHEMHDHQHQQHQRHGDHVEGEEAIQRDVRDRAIATDPNAEALADDWNRGEQVDDDLCAPVRHLTPRQQVAEERFGHQREVNETADDPQQLAWPAIAAVHEPTKHVQVDHDKKRRGAGRVQVADQPSAGDVAHDVLDRLERLGCVRLVVHRQEDAGDDLHHQHHQRERSEVVPKVEVLRRVVFRDL